MPMRIAAEELEAEFEIGNRIAHAITILGRQTQQRAGVTGKGIEEQSRKSLLRIRITLLKPCA
jgi:hypothetical protein